MKATKVQAEVLLTALFDDSPYTVKQSNAGQKRTWDAIARNEWWKEGQITLEGMEAANIPMVQQDCIKLTRPMTYTHTPKEGRNRTFTLQAGTIIQLLFNKQLHNKGHRQLMEGMIMLDDEQIMMRFYKPMRCEHMTIPITNVAKLLQEGRIYEQAK